MSLGDETEVPVAGAPCVQCVCRRGALVCRLQVCPVLPDPPPPSCIKIHRRGRCCPSLQCSKYITFYANFSYLAIFSTADTWHKVTTF